MATLLSAINFARAQAQTDSNGLTDANGIIFGNEALLDYRRRLITEGVDASQLQEAYMNGTVNVGTYAYPSDMFFLKAIEVNFTDTNEQNYITAKQRDISNIPGDVSFSYLRKNASTSSPLFDDRGDWFEIFPTPTSGNNLTNLFRIFYFLEPTEYSSTSDTIEYPESLDYRILGWRIAGSYLYAKQQFEAGDAMYNKYEERVTQLIQTLSRGVQTPLQAVPIQLSGWEF